MIIQVLLSLILVSTETYGSSAYWSLNPVELSTLSSVTFTTNKFSFDLYKAIASLNPGNIFLSPISLQMVLALASTGATGKTAQEIKNLLNLPNNQQGVLDGYKVLIKALEGHVMSPVNTIVVRNPAVLNEYFKTNAITYFKSKIVGAGQDSTPWMDSGNKVGTLLPNGIQIPATEVTLVSSVYFKNAWREAFRGSEIQPFKLPNGRTTSASMMYLDGNFEILHDNELRAKMIELKLNEMGLSMTVILPDDINGLREMERKLESMSFFRKRLSLQRKQVRVFFPKFVHRNTLDFKRLLESVGVSGMFRKGTPDFSSLSNTPISIHTVVQEAIIQISEEGVRAEGQSDLKFEESDEEEFNADHPFVFVISYNDIVIFIGRFAGPSQ